MREKMSRGKINNLIVSICFFCLLFTGAIAAAQNAINYSGIFKVQDNGDIKVLIKLTLPMTQYQKMRSNISNLYLMMRNLASHRSNVEVENKNAAWDDANRIITFSMIWRGVCVNTGKDWCLKVPPGTNFSNLDKEKKAVYFFVSTVSQEGKVNGQEQIIMPLRADNISWDNSKRIINYKLPASGNHFLNYMLWVLAIICFAASLLLLFSTRRSPAKNH